jgi:hypothetical protein
MSDPFDKELPPDQKAEFFTPEEIAAFNAMFLDGWITAEKAKQSDEEES